MLDANELTTLPRLLMEIERAWNERHDFETVHKLARLHPTLAAELYEFFSDLIEMGDPSGRGDSTSEKQDERVREWLFREGLRRAASAAASESTPTGTPYTRTIPSGDVLKGPRANETSHGPPTLIMILKGEAAKGLNEIAEALDMTPDLLVVFSTHAAVLPMKARNELIHRAKQRFGISEGLLTPTFGVGPPGRLQRAASRNSGYTSDTVTYDQLVKRSQLDDIRKEYWLRLG